MNLLLKKELRLVLPASLLVIALAWILGLANQIRFLPDLATLAIATLFAGAAGIAALGYGQELEQQTLVLQLTAPVTRRRLWWIKALALLAALVPLYFSLKHFMATGEQSQPFGLWLVQTAALVSFLTWQLRSIVGGAVIGGFTSAIWTALMEPTLWSKLAARFPEIEPLAETGRFVVTAAMIGGVTWLNYRSWTRAEIHSRPSTGSGLHTWRLMSFAKSPNRGKPLLNLLVKEIRLQSPAIVVAVPCIFLTLVLATIRDLLPDAMRVLQPQWIAISLLIVVVPLIIGSMAFAEERSLQSLQPVAMLPRKRRALFACKALVGCSLALALGFVLPLGFEALFAMNELNGMVLFTGVVFTWALSFFAGSFSPGTIRAVLATCGLGTVWLVTFPLLGTIWNPLGGFCGRVLDSFPALSLGNSDLRWILPTMGWAYATTMATMLLVGSYRLSFLPQPTRPDVWPVIKRLLIVHLVWAAVLIDLVKAVQIRIN